MAVWSRSGHLSPGWPSPWTRQNWDVWKGSISWHIKKLPWGTWLLEGPWLSQGHEEADILRTSTGKASRVEGEVADELCQEPRKQRQSMWVPKEEINFDLLPRRDKEVTPFLDQLWDLPPAFARLGCVTSWVPHDVPVLISSDSLLYTPSSSTAFLEFIPS